MEKNQEFQKIRELSLPLVPLRGKIAFPHTFNRFATKDTAKEMTVFPAERKQAPALSLIANAGKDSATKKK